MPEVRSGLPVVDRNHGEPKGNLQNHNTNHPGRPTIPAERTFNNWSQP
jgi:hypothetical protein